MVGVLTAAVIEATKTLVKITTERLLSSKGSNYHPSPDVVSQRLERHLLEVIRWSSQVQMFGMSEAIETTDATVALGIASEPRRFLAQGALRRLCDEGDLLRTADHILVLGEPGGGKTTTLKRLTHSVLTNPPVGDSDVWRYPLVLRLRELTEGLPLSATIAHVLGLEYSVDDEKAYTVKGVRLDAIIAELLDSSNVLLCLDGLDEIPSKQQTDIRREIVTLGYQMSTSKIIATTRSGDFTVNMDGFRVLELLPLTRAQQEQVAARWLTDPNGFFAAIDSVPYSDAISRPLVLTQLLLLYKHNAQLPDQPSRVYKRIVNLLLEDWNNRQEVPRISKYAGFEPVRKAEFLAVLAYHLTYKEKKKRFSRMTFFRVYERIYDQFGLPGHEASSVAQELETHTGLITTAADSMYEFSHLSLQEYLCAEYLVRSPSPESLEMYALEYQAPLAVAVSLAANPGEYLARLVMPSSNMHPWTWPRIQLLFDRLAVERPALGKSLSLGVFAMWLAAKFQNEEDVREVTAWFYSHPGVARSICSVLVECFSTPNEALIGASSMRLTRRPNDHRDIAVDVPEDLDIPGWALRHALDQQPTLILTTDPQSGQQVYLAADELGQFIARGTEG